MKKKITLIGQGQKFEIWSEEHLALEMEEQSVAPPGGDAANASSRVWDAMD